jgi:hypothetical protein
MGRPPKSLEPYREFISNLYLNEGFSREAIIERLMMEFEFNTTVPTLQPSLTKWTIRHRATFTPSKELKALIAFFFSTTYTTDENMFYNLRSLNYDIPNIQLLHQAHRAMGLRHRMLSSEVEAEKELLRRILKEYTID